MNSYFGTTVARRRLPHFRHSSASEPAANQPSTSRSEEQEISTTTGWVLLKQPDNQKPSCQPQEATQFWGQIRGSNPCRGATFCNQQLTKQWSSPRTNFVPTPPSPCGPTH